MNTYSLRIAQTVGSHDETPMVMIDATITADPGRFLEGGLPYGATAQDGSITVESFMALLSANGKELHAYFTTDAFGAFPGSFDLYFGKTGQPIGKIENVDISTALIPLAAEYVAMGFPDADNAWLASL